MQAAGSGEEIFSPGPTLAVHSPEGGVLEQRSQQRLVPDASSKTSATRCRSCMVTSSEPLTVSSTVYTLLLLPPHKVGKEDEVCN